MGRRLLIAIAAPLAACSLLSLPETNGTLTTASEGGGTPPPASNEAGVDASTVPTVDAGPDASAYVRAVAADKPVLWMRFDDKPGDPALDAVGGVKGTYETSGVTYGVTGAIANDPSVAVAFNGDEGAIAMPAGFDFTDTAPFSVEAWLKPASAAAQSAFFVDHQEYGTRHGWVLIFDGNVEGFERWNDTTHTAAFGPPHDTQWHHVVMAYDGTNAKLYVDGTPGDNHASTVALTPTTGWKIGKQNCSPCKGNGYAGAIDELAIYDKALIDVQIKAHYDAAR